MTEISINPDHHHILSADAKRVILLGYVDTGDKAPGDDDEACVLMILRGDYFAALDEWLDRKADYNRNGEFAGIGALVFEEAKLSRAKHHVARHLLEDASNWDGSDTRWHEMIDVRTFTATQFFVDMEHG